MKNCEEKPQKLCDISTFPNKIHVEYIPGIQEDSKCN